MNKVLQPIIHKDAYTRTVEREVIAWLREAVFMPLQLVLEEHGVRMNAEDSILVAALREGRIHYSQGVFSGRFNAAISRELVELGARFDRATRTFHVDPTDLPYELRGVLAESVAASAATHAAVLAVLAELVLNLPKASPGFEFQKALQPVFADLGKQFRQSVAVVPDFEMKLEMTEAERAKLARMLTENVELHIKGFLDERLPALRERVLQNLAEGGRTDRLADILQAEFGFSQRRAEFIADQETGLLVSKYRQIQYEDIGVQEYIWSTSLDGRVRPDHQLLHGRRFSFDSPPITDRATGRRNNPGCDYRCRCTAKPILNFIHA